MIYRSQKIVFYRGSYLRQLVCLHPHLLCQGQCVRPRSPIGQAFSSSDASWQPDQASLCPPFFPSSSIDKPLFNSPGRKKGLAVI